MFTSKKLFIFYLILSNLKKNKLKILLFHKILGYIKKINDMLLDFKSLKKELT